MKIFANFKMNKTPSETKEYLMNLVPKSKDFKQEITICLPYTSLAMGKFMIEGTNIKLGAQNLSEDDVRSWSARKGILLTDDEAEYAFKYIKINGCRDSDS